MSGKIWKFWHLCLRFAIIPNAPEARIVNLSTKVLYIALTPHLFHSKHNGMFHDNIRSNTG